MSYDLLKSGTLVNFNTKSSIFKTEYKAVKVEAVASAEIAQGIDDIKARHLQIKPYIPGLPNLYTDYSYVIVTMENGTKEVLGLPWIIENSITISSKKNYQLILEGVEPEQVEIIRAALVNRRVSIQSFTEIT